MDSEPIARFFDRGAEPCCHEGPEDGDGIAGVSSVLFEQLEAVGVEDRTVLDLGCGTGNLALEALRRGAARVTGIDLSPVSIEVARRRARRSGVADRVAFEVGDASGGAPVHDVVVLDKAICCYPQPERLVASSIPAAARAYAFSVPASRGVWGMLSRAVIRGENLWRWLRRDPFRAFVHDVSRIESALVSAGFRAAARTRWWMWHAATYVRDS